ncbi:hypothetical protein BH23GEM9_BH23GEM9_19650 [soil metagenome]
MNETKSSPTAQSLGHVIALLMDAPVRMATALAGAATQATARGCEIPPPCWQPRRAGSCHMTLTPGGTGILRIHVTNCEWSRQVAGINASGKLAGWLTLNPTMVVIEPQETATIVVTVHVPANMKPGVRLTGLLLVRGCLDHAVRLEVTVADCAQCAVCDISIQDCPDHIHHWYDHFYCPRPCRNQGRTADTPSTPGILANG